MTNDQNTYNQPQMPPQPPMPQGEAFVPPQGGAFMPPVPPRSMTRRARWGQQLMAGKTLITNSLPNWFATYAFATYMVALFGVNILFSGRGTEWYFMLFGIAWVAGFFFLSVKFSKEWSVLKMRKPKAFEKKLFQVGLSVRVLYAIFVFYFYISMTGVPHEFAAADSISYIETAEWMVRGWDGGYFWEVVSQLATTSFSDLGYPLYILLPVKIFEGNAVVFFILIINSLFGAYTSVILYRIARRSMDETTARLTAIFCMLHPVLICYCGLTLKEVFMTWLLVLFIDMADRLLRSRKYAFSTIAPMVLAGGALFMFRTVLGLVAFMAVFFALVMMDTKIVSWGRKVVLGVGLAGIIIFSVSDNIMREVDKIRNTDVRQEQETSMTKRYGSEKGGEISGNRFADYAGAAVFAPLIFTIPFPTMVNPGFQEDMRLIHGGNWMRNVMSGFVILAMVMLLLTGDWRQYTLPLAALLGYLVVLVFSSFAHSLRFHIPVMPFEMLFAAYAITNMRKKHKTWYMIWCILMIVTCFGWNWMKLRGRGL